MPLLLFPLLGHALAYAWGLKRRLG